jgi:hypothetical protein
MWLQARRTNIAKTTDAPDLRQHKVTWERPGPAAVSHGAIRHMPCLIQEWGSAGTDAQTGASIALHVMCMSCSSEVSRWCYVPLDKHLLECSAKTYIVRLTWPCLHIGLGVGRGISCVPCRHSVWMQLGVGTGMLHAAGVLHGGSSCITMFPYHAHQTFNSRLHDVCHLVVYRMMQQLI